MDDHDFKGSLQKWIGMPVREVQKIPHGYLVECGSEEARSRVMNFNGVELNHRVVKVTYGEKSMTGTQIFDFVAGALSMSEEIRGVPQPKKEREGRPPWRQQVRSVDGVPDEAWDEWGEFEGVGDWEDSRFSCQAVSGTPKGGGKGKGKGKGKGRGRKVGTPEGDFIHQMWNKNRHVPMRRSCDDHPPRQRRPLL